MLSSVSRTTCRKVRHLTTMSKARFDIYVKAASDGVTVGDCPFSMRVNMYARLKLPPQNYSIIPVDISNKPDEFLALNTDGKVPVLVDTESDKVVADSAEITKYLNSIVPTPNLEQDYAGPAVQASGGIFGKLAALLKNTDQAAIPQLRADLEMELRRLDEYLSSADCKGRYLVCDNICELDCSVLPKLRHVQVAGKHFQGFEIPQDCTHLWKYIKDAEQSDVFKQTCPPDEEIIKGWSRHNIMVVKP